MSWTNKQRLSLSGAACIQIALFWMFFHQAAYPPALPKDGNGTRMLLAHLVERIDTPAMISREPVSASASPTVEPQSEASLKISGDYSSAHLPDEEFLLLPDYLPAALLTDKPSILIDIDPELSRRFAFILPQSLELELLINEYGDVDRVLLAEPLAAGGSVEALPPVLLEELMQHFLEARFLPGRLHGQPVRSTLKIRVSLEP